MSTQSEREAAARAWFAEPTHDTATALLALIEPDAGGWYCQTGGYRGTMEGALSAWLAWAKADAAKVDAKPAQELAADALEGLRAALNGFVLIDAAKMLGWCLGSGSATDVADLPPPEADQAFRLARIRDRSGVDRETWRAALGAHARAQLAREAHEAAPAQPAALTLEQARAMCREAGDTVVEAPPRPNYVKPAEMLAWFEASVAVRKAAKHMGDAASRCAMQDRDAWTETPDDCTVESEIGRLRALGVTPAVLS